MRDLKKHPKIYNYVQAEEFLKGGAITIFEKIEFSDITKDALKAKIYDLETRQVPERGEDILRNISDAEVTEYWFKNWLHPKLKHFFPTSPKDKRGCSKEVLARDQALDMLNFYENGQQNYDYTLDDIKAYLEE